MAYASADEEARHQLWLDQREMRVAKRRELELAMMPDPAFARAVMDGYMPLVLAAADARLPEVDEGPDSKVIVNHDLNL